jgi:hypothetical protein
MRCLFNEGMLYMKNIKAGRPDWNRSAAAGCFDERQMAPGDREFLLHAAAANIVSGNHQEAEGLLAVQKTPVYYHIFGRINDLLKDKEEWHQRGSINWNRLSGLLR